MLALTGNGSAVGWALGRDWWVVCWAALQEQCLVVPCGSCRISTNRCAQSYLVHMKIARHLSLANWPVAAEGGAGAAQTVSPPLQARYRQPGPESVLTTDNGGCRQKRCASMHLQGCSLTAA